jgi:hypothetical protein
MHHNISVKDSEIFIAKRGVTTRCAIAAAIMTQVPSARYIKVDRDTISWLDIDRQERLVFRTPEQGRDFIEHWDAGEAVQPISFALTDSKLVERRPPRAVSPRTRLKRQVNPPVRNPGSRMTRRRSAMQPDPGQGS